MNFYNSQIVFVVSANAKKEKRQSYVIPDPL